MRSRLTIKFLLGYLAFAFFSFLLITYVSSWMIERNNTEKYAGLLYSEAYYLADICSDITPSLSDTASISKEASYAATFTGCQVWVVSPTGSIICDSNHNVSGQVITDFDPIDRSESTYSIGTFYNMFDHNVLSVQAPVTSDRVVTGYVIMHMPMSSVGADADTMRVLYITGLIIFIGSFVFLLMYYVMIHRPMKKITKAADEFANGNLDYKIDISKYDELGSLAATLNYMTGELRGMEESQRKFISNISHDLRSPLTSIKGYLEAMLDGTIPPEKFDYYMQIAVSEANRLMTMTQRTLELKSIESNGAILDLSNFDINDTIRRTATSFKGVCMERGIVLDLTFEDEKLMVRADESKITQVLYNLIDNAIKFSDDENDIWIETYTKSDKAFISVKDVGCGIKSEDILKIWNRFYKGDQSRGAKKNSTGLGLAICKEIINNHGQTIDVISTEGAGSEFIFTLKLA